MDSTRTRRRRILRTATCLILTLPLAGCTTSYLVLNNAQHMTVERAFTPRQDMRFRVLDAETGEPIANATVVASNNFDLMDDWSTSAKTNDTGIATIRVATQFMDLLNVRADADGYLIRYDIPWRSAKATGASVGETPPPPGVATVEPDRNAVPTEPVEIVLYRGPAMKIGLSVPPDYRGLITYSVGSMSQGDSQFRYPLNLPAGTRVRWSYAHPPANAVVAPAFNLGFGGWDGNPVEAVEQDGRPLPVPDPGSQQDGIAAWHIGYAEIGGIGGTDIHALVIGTRDDALAEACRLLTSWHEGSQARIYTGWARELEPDSVRASDGAYTLPHNLLMKTRRRY